MFILVYYTYGTYVYVVCVCVLCSMDFDYLCEVPVLTLDVNDDFKDDKFKCADMIEKVLTFFLSFPFLHTHIYVHAYTKLMWHSVSVFRWINEPIKKQPPPREHERNCILHIFT